MVGCAINSIKIITVKIMCSSDGNNKNIHFIFWWEMGIKKYMIFIVECFKFRVKIEKNFQIEVEFL